MVGRVELAVVGQAGLVESRMHVVVVFVDFGICEPGETVRVLWMVDRTLILLRLALVGLVGLQ